MLNETAKYNVETTLHQNSYFIFNIFLKTIQTKIFFIYAKSNVVLYQRID